MVWIARMSGTCYVSMVLHVWYVPLYVNGATCHWMGQWMHVWYVPLYINGSQTTHIATPNHSYRNKVKVVARCDKK